MLFVKFAKCDGAKDVSYEMKMVIRRAIEATLLTEGIDRDAEVSVTLCDNAYIKELNKRFRGVDRHTDVLSFPMFEIDELDDCIGDLTLGDVVISTERAKEQADEVGNSFLQEVAFLTVHSILHLLGYDHERSEEDDELQCRKQREIINELKGNLVI